MGLLKRLFGEKPGADLPTSSSGHERPAWMRDGMEVTVFVGQVGLEVVGESFYQDSLWRIAGVRRGETVRLETVALLAADEDNEYDPNAISVWIAGLKVGHLSRDDAQAMRPGLLALEQDVGKKIALQGHVVGGGMRPDGPGNLGVFLEYDPEDFGLPSPQRRQVRTGLSDARWTDEQDDSYDLAWLDELPDNDLAAIPRLRELLQDDPDPIDRHYMFDELEKRLYKSRDAFGSALDEYDEVCRQHDSELDGIRQALVEKLDAVPLLETYKQQTIRQQKAGDLTAALWWAERGRELYGDDAARPEWPNDLRNRRDRLRAKLGGNQTRP